MNAVERLLAHGEQVVSLFDEMLDSRADPDPLQADCILRRLREWHPPHTPFADTDVELSAAPPRYRQVLNEQRLRLMGTWWSAAALDAAARKAIANSAGEERGPGDARDLSPLALDLYCRMLERREELLSPTRMHNLAADVVAESPLWGLLAKAVVERSERAIASLRFLSCDNPKAYKLGPHPSFRRTAFNVEVIVRGAVRSPKEWLAQRAENIMPALDSLRPYAKPPAAAGSSPDQQTSSDRPPKARDRTGVGGRKEKWSKAMKQRILKDRSVYERKMKKRKQPPLKKEAWVRKEWATAQSPSIEPDEAVRLWRAAKREQYR